MKLEYLEKYLSENNGVVLHEESNTWDNYSKEWNVNYSSILSVLIKEAAKCEFYSSDLFIYWIDIEKSLHEMKEGDKKYYTFGFRNNGVDGNTFVNARIRCKQQYFSIYVLTMEVVDKRSDGILEMEMILYRYK